jgi:hypothetical protein
MCIHACIILNGVAGTIFYPVLFSKAFRVLRKPSWFANPNTTRQTAYAWYEQVPQIPNNTKAAIIYFEVERHRSWHEDFSPFLLTAFSLMKEASSTINPDLP